MASHYHASIAAAAAWFQPVVRAFNDSHPGLRASYVAQWINVTPAGATFNPQVSCLVGHTRAGVSGIMVDLSPYLLHVNFDTAALLPGLMTTVTSPQGQVTGLPVDLRLLAVQYGASALQARSVAPPPASGWTDGAFLRAVSALSNSPAGRLATFGADLAMAWGTGAFYGYAEGFGGDVFGGGRVSLTSAASFRGLQAYAEVLAETWVGMAANIRSTPDLGFAYAGWSPGGKSWADQGYTRFPLMPVVPCVPAQVAQVGVPRHARQPAAGATFAMWLLGPEGQGVMTALGFPPMRQDGNLAGSWLSANGTGTTPDQLRFPTSPVPADIVTMGDVVTAALSAKSALQLPALQAIEAAANGFLGGSISATACVAQYLAALHTAGISDIPPWLVRIA